MALNFEFLLANPYFSGLSPAELDSIKGYIFEKTAAGGDLISIEGEPTKAMYFVVSGAVKMFKTSSDGKEQVLRYARTGESFNDAEVFYGGPNLASARAIVPVVLYGITKEDIETILHNHPRVSLNATQVLAHKVQQLVSLVEDLSFKHVIARVAKILLEYAGDAKMPKQRLTQQEMAAIAGTAREMIGRSLKSLQTEGAIRLDRHRIIITDREALREIAEK